MREAGGEKREERSGKKEEGGEKQEERRGRREGPKAEGKKRKKLEVRRVRISLLGHRCKSEVYRLASPLRHSDGQVSEAVLRRRRCVWRYASRNFSPLQQVFIPQPFITGQEYISVT